MNKNRMNIVVTGGLGFVGSHACVEILDLGHNICIIDNLKNSDIGVLEKLQAVTKKKLDFYKIDIRNESKLRQVFKSFNPDLVMHFAGLKSVEESVINPLSYYDSNVSGSLVLLKVMHELEVHKIIFSSSATVYGVPKYLPYDEKHTKNPINPYGKTKLFVEQIIEDWCNSNLSRVGICLRYFNPVGAHASGLLGENSASPPTNLMPLICRVAKKYLNHLSIFGDDYDTSDGTCLRDYIHVVDIAKAHALATKVCQKFTGFECINLGRGEPVSVFEIIKTFEAVSKRKIDYKIVDRRKGDLPAYWADSKYAEIRLNWKPELSLEKMCADTWNWQMKS